MLVNANLQRLSVTPSPLRLTPPEPLPESFVRRFPELRDWEAKNLEIWKKNEQALVTQIAIAGTPIGG